MYANLLTGVKKDEFLLTQYTEEEDDNVKIFQIISVNGNDHYIDHSPYEPIDHSCFDNYIKFYRKQGLFPDRSNIESIGPLDSEDIRRLVYDS